MMANDVPISGLFSLILLISGDHEHTQWGNAWKERRKSDFKIKAANNEWGLNATRKEKRKKENAILKVEHYKVRFKWNLFIHANAITEPRKHEKADGRQIKKNSF